MPTLGLAFASLNYLFGTRGDFEIVLKSFVPLGIHFAIALSRGALLHFLQGSPRFNASDLLTITRKYGLTPRAFEHTNIWKNRHHGIRAEPLVRPRQIEVGDTLLYTPWTNIAELIPLKTPSI